MKLVFLLNMRNRWAGRVRLSHQQHYILAEAGEQDGVAGDSATSDEEAGAVGGPGEIKYMAAGEVCELTGFASSQRLFPDIADAILGAKRLKSFAIQCPEYRRPGVSRDIK